MPAHSGDLTCQDETRPGVRPALDHENTGAFGQVLRGNTDLLVGKIARRILRQERDRRVGARRERRATRRAEIRFGWIAMAAVVAEHSCDRESVVWGKRAG